MTSPKISVQITRKYSVFEPSQEAFLIQEREMKAKATTTATPTTTTTTTTTTTATTPPPSTNSNGVTPPSREEVERYILQTLASQGTIPDTGKLASEMGWSENDAVGAMKSLEVEYMVVSSPKEEQIYVVTKEGQSILTNGVSPEFWFWKEVKNAPGGKGIPAKGMNEAQKLGMGVCMAKRWVVKDGDFVQITSPEITRTDETLINLKAVAAGTTAVPDPDLLKRKLVKQQTRKYFGIEKGPKYAVTRGKGAVAELTRAMLDDGSWKTTEFKPYNFQALGQPVGGGTLHPLLKVRFEFRKILLGMGFEEMPTARWVESSFWNFDSLFQPQQHPARDAHDTFFISGPAASSSLSPEFVPSTYLSEVQSTHESGGRTGSAGYRYDWDVREARKNVLRTHTTAISSQMLFALARQPGGFRPKKYFSVDRVFRNETIDKTHLAEFHQVEGLVADYGLTLGDLKGTIRAFFAAIGITRVRFKAAYNPYTEPSMEIFGFHPQLNKWTEIGNSGMFRPEMLLPMGLPKDVRVIAWGLSLERPTMIMTGESHIKSLFGSGVSFDMMRTFPLVRFKRDSQKEEDGVQQQQQRRENGEGR